MFNHKLVKLVLLVTLVFVVSTTAFAQFSARTLGLGDEFVTVDGPAAIYGNPAAVNLSPDRFTLELSTGIHAWNNLLMNDYISDSDKSDVLKAAEDGFAIGVEGRQGTKLIIGPLAFANDFKQQGLVNLPSDVAEILLKGNQIGKTYDFSDISGEGALYGDGMVNFSTQAPANIVSDWGVKEVHMGFSYHQLAGVIFDVEGTGSTEITYDENGEPTATGDSHLKVKYNEQDIAMGSALDLGSYAKINDRYSVGISILGLGALTADSYHYQEYKYDESKDLNESTEGDSNQELSWKLPSTIRMGGKMNYNQSITIFGDYSHTSYNDGQVEHKFATGSEFTWLGWLPLRTGLNYSTLKDEFKWSTGFGLYLGPLKADLGVSDLTGLFNNAKGTKTAVTTKIEF